MPQQDSRDPRKSTGRAPTDARTGNTQLIEKGWSVHDAVDRAIGNVTDVDTARGVLVVDGRPVGFEAFEVPLSIVSRTSPNDVFLSKVLDPKASANDDVPHFVDPPRDVTAATSAASASAMAGPRSSASSTMPNPVTSTRVNEATVQTATPSRTTEVPTPMASSAGTSQSSTASLTSAGVQTPPLDPAKPRATTLPHAAAAPTDPRVTPMYPDDYREPDRGWTATSMTLSGLGIGGLAIAGYLLRQKLRRKSRFERFMDTTSEWAGLTADFARDRNPAWWGGLAATVLPLAAYYAWPEKSSSVLPMRRPETPSEQLADLLDRGLSELSTWLPTAGSGSSNAISGGVRRLQDSVSGLEMPDNWNRPSQWSVPTEAALSAALIAVSGLAIYLARRNSHTTRSARITDVMTRRPKTIQPNATVADAAALMRQMDVGGLPVCDGSRLIGMVTDRDITIRSAADGRDPHLTPVRDIMSSGVAWATEDDPVEEAARIMREHRIRRLPVVDQRHSLVGIVSLGDLAVDVDDRNLSGQTLEDISEPSKPDR